MEPPAPAPRTASHAAASTARPQRAGACPPPCPPAPGGGRLAHRPCGRPRLPRPARILVAAASSPTPPPSRSFDEDDQLDTEPSRELWRVDPSASSRAKARLDLMWSVGSKVSWKAWRRGAGRERGVRAARGGRRGWWGAAHGCPHACTACGGRVMHPVLSLPQPGRLGASASPAERRVDANKKERLTFFFFERRPAPSDLAPTNPLTSSHPQKNRAPATCDCCGGAGSQSCTWCRGTGAMMVGGEVFCSLAGGCKGCPVCNSAGTVPCQHCKGTGSRAAWLGPGCPVD